MSLILLVDDDALSLEFMKIFLEDEGYQVVTACSEQQAMTVYKETAPDIVVTDIDLGRSSGITLAKLLREKGVQRIIGITGYGKAHLEERGVLSLFENVLTKPVELNDLKRVLESS